jgi:hypothetical protein
VKDLWASLKTLHACYAPWISLALGVLTRVLSHRGVDFAPKAVAILALAWLLPLAITRWLHAPPQGTREPRFHCFVRTVSPTVTVLLYKNVLFFLVPIWFGSSHVDSINVLVPVLLGAMAVFSCFAQRYRELVLDNPRVRVLWTAVILFAALVPATAVVAFTSPRTSIIISALVASVVAWLALAPTENLLAWRGLLSMVRLSLLATAVLGLAAPLFPPVPFVCHDHGIGTMLVNRELVGRAQHFPSGTHKVFAWFEVTLPRRDRQPIAFQWYRDGGPVGPPVRTSVEGGRKNGYRTATSRLVPAVGSWRVDLVTGQSSQLIGRSTFVVDP